LQAGYGYASVVDPTTQADSNVLPVLAQLLAGLLFFTTGLHRYVISAFAASLDSYPPGNFTVSQDFAKTVVQVGSSLFSTGLRLAFPIIGLLLMTDIALGVLGRLSSQLQMGQNAFPVKMLLTLVMLAAVVAVAPSLYGAYSSEVFRTIRASFAH
jgi:flagellar biosynthetic protein FliR